MSRHIGRSMSTPSTAPRGGQGVNIPVEYSSIDLDNTRETDRQIYFKGQQPALYSAGQPDFGHTMSPQDQPLPEPNSNQEQVLPAITSSTVQGQITHDENGNDGTDEDLRQGNLTTVASAPVLSTPGSPGRRHSSSHPETATSQRLHSASASSLDDVSRRIQGRRLRAHHQEGVTSSMRKRENLIYRSTEGDTHIIVFTEDGSKYYTLELTRDEGGLACRSKQYTGDILSLERLGKVALTRKELHEAGLTVTDRFGVFHQFFNNSRDFCNDFLREIGLGNHVTNVPLKRCVRTRPC